MPGYHRFRLPEAYRALLSLTARGFAWEWLRRNPGFRAVYLEAGAGARLASTRADDAVRRSRRPIANLPVHPCARRWTHWGVGFRPAA
jgi:hypothetical protein